MLINKKRLRNFVMSIFNVGNDENGHDKPDAFYELEDLAVNLAHLSEYQNGGVVVYI